MDDQVRQRMSVDVRSDRVFEFYHEGLANVPKISVDGTVDDALHLSHWRDNETPEELRADTSTEIALNFVVSPRREEYAKGIKVVTNNHFDTDGVLSVWTVLTGERATNLRDSLIAAAEAGDFSENTGANAIRASLIIQGSDNPVPFSGVASPLARSLAKSSVDERQAYELVLPEVENVLTRIDDYESLWRDPWNAIERSLDSFERGASRVVEYRESKLSLVILAPELFGEGGFSPIRHAAPFTAISHNAKGEIFVIATPLAGGWSYRVDYPYFSWAQTVVRPQIVRRDLNDLIKRLNDVESASGSWIEDSSEMTSALKFVDARRSLVPSKLEPDAVAQMIAAFLQSQTGIDGSVRQAVV